MDSTNPSPVDQHSALLTTQLDLIRNQGRDLSQQHNSLFLRYNDIPSAIKQDHLVSNHDRAFCAAELTPNRWAKIPAKVDSLTRTVRHISAAIDQRSLIDAHFRLATAVTYLGQAERLMSDLEIALRAHERVQVGREMLDAAVRQASERARASQAQRYADSVELLAIAERAAALRREAGHPIRDESAQGRIGPHAQMSAEAETSVEGEVSWRPQPASMEFRHVIYAELFLQHPRPKSMSPRNAIERWMRDVEASSSGSEGSTRTWADVVRGV